MNIKLIVCLLPLILVADLAVAEIYKWVDDSGNVHYSDSPPPGDSADEVQLAPEPDPQALQQAREDLDRRIQYQREDSEARRAAKENKKQQQQQQAAQAAELEARCRFARQQLVVVDTQRPVYRENKETGEREYADDEYRAGERARFNKEIAEYCP